MLTFYEPTASSSVLVCPVSRASIANMGPNVIRTRGLTSARTAALAGKSELANNLRFRSKFLIERTSILSLMRKPCRYRTGLTVVRCSCPLNYNGSLCEFRREFAPAKGD